MPADPDKRVGYLGNPLAMKTSVVNVGKRLQAQLPALFQSVLILPVQDPSRLIVTVVVVVVIPHPPLAAIE